MLIILPEEVVVDMDSILIRKLMIGRMVMPEVFPVTGFRVRMMPVRSCSPSFLLCQSFCFRFTGCGNKCVENGNHFTFRKGLLRHKSINPESIVTEARFFDSFTRDPVCQWTESLLIAL